MKYTLPLFVVAILFSFSAPCSGDLIVEYLGLNGASQSAINGAAATGTVLTRGPGINQAGGSNFNSNGFDTSSTSLASALTANDYLTFGFSVNAGSTISLTDIIVEMDRSGTGPDTVYLLHDGNSDGFDTGDLLQQFAIPDPGAILTFNSSLPSSLTAASGVNEFRFYYSGASNGSGTSDIEDDLIGNQIGLQINGSVSAIPEPGSALLVCGLVLGGLVTRRKK